LGLVDDARFAASWARARFSAGFGPQRVARELAEKGIADELAADAITEAVGDDDQIERARRLLGNTSLETRNERDKAVRKLVRKGFDLRTALKAAEKPEE
ncbi:MAG TPA: regulatory protein RecX, partial [Coriobacteriia bacterium]|nr:regulatory protein RecX [Coriobacteriia bacterium]